MERIILTDGRTIIVKTQDELDESEKNKGCSARIFCHNECPYCSVTDVEESPGDPMGRVRIRMSCQLDKRDQAFPISFFGYYQLVRNWWCIKKDPKQDNLTEADRQYCERVYNNNYAVRFGKHWAY